MMMDAKTKPAVAGVRMFQVPLAVLMTAAEADYGDVRRDPSTKIGDLVTSIRAVGLLFPLGVKPAPKDARKHVVVAGNRRLRALREIHGAKSEVLVPVVDSDAVGAIELGLVESVLNLPHHPVSRFEAFAALEQEGMSPDDIAARFGISLNVVRQSRAIEALAPEVREAWRAGKLSAEAAQAFTLETSRKRQASILKEQLGRGDAHEYNIRRLIVGDKSAAANLVAFVGVEAYRAAGGKMQEDLFTERHAIEDPALAKRLADEKLDGVCQGLVLEGWAWAARAETLPQPWQYSWGRIKIKPELTPEEKQETARFQAMIDADDPDADDTIDPAEEIERIEVRAMARAFAPKQRARSGVVVAVGRDGSLDASYGIIRPGEHEAEAGEGAGAGGGKKKPAKKKAAGEEGAGGGTTNALMERLSTTLTLAARDAIADGINDSKLGIAALLAGLEVNQFESPVRANLYGHQADAHRKKEMFEAVFTRMMGKNTAELLKAAAIVAGRALNMVSHRGDAPPLKEPGAAALCRAIHPRAMGAALLSLFDAGDYFASVSKAACLAALKEMGGTEPSLAAAAKAPKADLAKLAAKEAKESKWLPPELRVEAAGKKAPAKAAAKKGRRR